MGIWGNNKNQQQINQQRQQEMQKLQQQQAMENLYKYNDQLQSKAGALSQQVQQTEQQISALKQQFISNRNPYQQQQIEQQLKQLIQKRNQLTQQYKAYQGPANMTGQMMYQQETLKMQKDLANIMTPLNQQTRQMMNQLQGQGYYDNMLDMQVNNQEFQVMQMEMNAYNDQFENASYDSNYNSYDDEINKLKQQQYMQQYNQQQLQTPQQNQQQFQQQ